MERKGLSPHYAPRGQPKGPLTRGASTPHHRLIPLASLLPNNALRGWLCPHSNCPWFLGQEPPQEKYLLPLSHTCGVSNSNTEIYFGHTLTAPVKGIGKETHLLESMKKSPKSFWGCNHTKLAPPNILWGWFCKRLWCFWVRCTLHTLARENFLKRRFPPSASIFQMVTRVGFFSETYTHLLHKYMFSYSQVPGTFLGVVSVGRRQVSVIV